MANPYAKFLTSQDVMEQVESTPARLSAAVDACRAKGLDTSPGPGKWNVRQIVAHMTDTEIAFGFRLRQAAAESAYVIQPFDQEKWAAGYASADVETALELFRMLRKWNVQFLRSLAPEVFEKKVTHPERGTMTFQTIVETMAGHDNNHLVQLIAA